MSTLTVRKLNIDLSRGFGRHWLGGDAYRTQLFNALSMSFPIGEQSFIDSLRRVPEACLTDPALREQLKNFIGQEASHRFVHAQFNAQLNAQGLEYILERSVLWRLRLIERHGDLRNWVAITCAFEHFTAMLADGVLTRPRWIGDAEAELKTLWSWHAAEEIEHKAVAFDVFKAAGGGYWRRVLWFIHICFVFAADIAIQTTHNLYRDGTLFKPRTWLSAVRTWFGRDGLLWHIAPPALAYLSPSFHPMQHDNLHLTRQWLDDNSPAYRELGPRP
jgi:predicted metal-dependent hydrolase